MPFDALVLLGCRVTNDRLAGAAGRRAERAARAFHEGLAPRIVVSGGRRWDGVMEAEALARELEARGVPADALLLERGSHNTLENARFTARLLAPLGVSRVGVVTCDWHLARAVWTFRRAGLDAQPIAAVSPRLPPLRRFLRAVRERVTSLLGRAAAIGW